MLSVFNKMTHCFYCSEPYLLYHWCCRCMKCICTKCFPSHYKPGEKRCKQMDGPTVDYDNLDRLYRVRNVLNNSTQTDSIKSILDE